MRKVLIIIAALAATVTIPVAAQAQTGGFSANTAPAEIAEPQATSHCGYTFYGRYTDPQ
ncbi:MAG: hypothetical protein RLO50_22505 [Azospirillaceae bacterium]